MYIELNVWWLKPIYKVFRKNELKKIKREKTRHNTITCGYFFEGKMDCLAFLQ